MLVILWSYYTLVTLLIQSTLTFEQLPGLKQSEMKIWAWSESPITLSCPALAASQQAASHQWNSFDGEGVKKGGGGQGGEGGHACMTCRRRAA